MSSVHNTPIGDGSKLPKSDSLLAEITALRNEIQDLKRCQLHYFGLSISGTAAIFGLAVSFAKGNFGGFIFLAPLTIVLPCWLIFFDKATSITRNSGYQRILEHLLNYGTPIGYTHLGTESSLAIYRSGERSAWIEVKKHIAPEKSSPLSFQVRHRYWRINWLTYVALSSVCWLGALILILRRTALLTPVGKAFAGSALFAAAFLIGACGVYTYVFLHRLINGQYSYDNCAKIWRTVLGFNESQSLSGNLRQKEQT